MPTPDEEKKARALKEDADEGTPAAPYHETRLSAIEAIAEHSEEERAGEMEEVPDEGAASQEEEPAGDKKDKKEPDESKEEPEPDKAKEAEPELVTVKIDGEEKQVSQAEIDEAGGIPAYQKNVAADKRLAAAAVAQKAADETLERAEKLIGKKEQPPDEGAGPTQETEQAETLEDAEVEEKLKAISKAIQYGDEQESAAALKDLTQLMTGRGPQAATLTEEEVDERVEKRFQAREAEKIRVKFKSSPEEGGFSDVLNDPDLFLIARQRINSRLEKGESNTWEIYQAVGEEVREKFLTSKTESSEEKESEDDLARRREEKKKIDNVRAASQSAYDTSPEKEKSEQEERSDAVKEIAKGRGQHTVS